MATHRAEGALFLRGGNGGAWRRGAPRLLVLVCAAAAGGALLAGCGDGGGARLGDPCADDSACASGFCYQSRCMDPSLDLDEDGLTNAQERERGTDPYVADNPDAPPDDGTDDGGDGGGPPPADAETRALCAAACDRFVVEERSGAERLRCDYGGGEFTGVIDVGVSGGEDLGTPSASPDDCRAACEDAVASSWPCSGALEAVLRCTRACDCEGCALCQETFAALAGCLESLDPDEAPGREPTPPGTPWFVIAFGGRRHERFQVLAATPLVAAGDDVTAACTIGAEDVATGLELAFVWRGTARSSFCEGGEDRDVSFAPGDWIAGAPILRLDPGTTVTPDTFAVALDCVAPRATEDAARCAPGSGALEARVAAVEWQPSFPGAAARCEPAAVVVLVDQSGSIRGFVDPAHGWREDEAGTFAIPPDAERQAVASDPHNARLAAVVELLDELNADDRVAVLGFQSGGDGPNVAALCELAPLPAEGAWAGVPEHLRQAAACFGAGRDTTRAAVLDAFGSEGGRTPLWEALRDAHALLREPALGAAASRHIIVIGDGPDTCAPTADERIVDEAHPACSAVSFEALRDAVIAGNDAELEAPVHLHFIQLAAAGYPDPDPRQVELACRTGGQHAFIDVPTQESEAFQAAVMEAVGRARGALAGRWVLRAEVPGLAAALTDGEAAPRGVLLGVSGDLTLRAGTLVHQDATTVFDGQGDPDLGGGDARLLLRHACASAADCAWAAVASAAQCSAQQQVCTVAPP